MATLTSFSSQSIQEFIDGICSRLAEGERVRSALPGGRLRIDRALSFLLIHRRTPEETRGIETLITGEASYLIASGEREHLEDVRSLTRSIAETLSNEFGAFLIVEIWSGNPPPSCEESDNKFSIPPCACFQIVVPENEYSSKTVDALRKALRQIRVNQQQAQVAIKHRNEIAPPGMPPLVRVEDAAGFNCSLLGLEVDPVWQNPDTGEFYPLLLHHLRRSFGYAMKRGEYTFTTAKTTRRPAHYLALGPQSVTRAVWNVDARLAEIGDSFDLLLAVTPTNSELAWQAFKESRYDRAPELYYRPVDVDPDLLKRRLYAIEMERIEDPVLADLFIEKREEIDTRLTMLRDRGRQQACYESMQLFDVPSIELVRTAEEMLSTLAQDDGKESGSASIEADEFASMVEEEYEYYRNLKPDFTGSVQIRDDIGHGLLVSEGALLIGTGTRIPRNRAQALLQHEVGTHVMTYFNGRTQRLRQLCHGLAGYDDFQEGVAVLAEYLVGGLSCARLRVLAARVLAVEAMLERGTFVDVFRLLTKKYGFGKHSAFTMTMRVFRGGGLTKDAVYLRGLERVLDYLRNDGDINALFVGKIAARHIPVIRELQLRGVVHTDTLLPRYLSDPHVIERLDQVRTSTSVLDLLPKKNTSEMQLCENENRTAH